VTPRPRRLTPEDIGAIIAVAFLVAVAVWVLVALS
jgi:hypothetical protein